MKRDQMATIKEYMNNPKEIQLQLNTIILYGPYTVL